MQDVKPVIDAMRTVVLFREMYELCMGRIPMLGKNACDGCPYMHNGVCGKISTADLIANVANVFQEFLEEQE